LVQFISDLDVLVTLLTFQLKVHWCNSCCFRGVSKGSGQI